MRSTYRFALTLTAAAALTLTGCKKTADTKPNFESSINGYYETHPACLWSTAQKFPVQMGHDDSKTTRFDALFDQGLLTRTSTEKKIIIISKRETNYDLSDKGRAAWTADPSQPGYGNFCYGHRKVASVDSYTPTNDQPGSTTTVQYKYTLTGVPDWAKAAETQTAYPKIAANIAATPKIASAVMTNTSNGWQMSKSVASQTMGSDIVE